MTEVSAARNALGFTILEMLIAMSVFLIICAAMFGLLQMSQTRYASENQLSASFQEARLAMDQIVRDVNVAGYPSLSLYSSVPTDPSTYAAGPVAWSPNYYRRRAARLGPLAVEPARLLEISILSSRRALVMTRV